MGGRVFHSRGWQAPRLSPKLYTAILTQIRPVLDDLFTRVCCPPSVWEKTDHGDLDFIVVDENEVDPAEVAEKLGAKAFIVNGPSTSYAIPHPDDPKHIVQIDVKRCPADLFDWQAFTDSYADLGIVLAYLLRPAGLKITDKGLFLRVPRVYGKADILWLSDDPKKVMRFLGLPVNRFETGFATEFQVFDFLLAGHLVRPEVKATELRKKDRVNLRKRPMFRRFIEDYPGGPHGGGEEEAEMGGKWHDKEKVKDKALEYFDMDNSYEVMLGRI